MAKTPKRKLYGANGEFVAMVQQAAIAYDGGLIVECADGHFYLVSADELVRGEPAECPKCERDSWMRAAA